MTAAAEKTLRSRTFAAVAAFADLDWPGSSQSYCQAYKLEPFSSLGQKRKMSSSGRGWMERLFVGHE